MNNSMLRYDEIWNKGLKKYEKKTGLKIIAKALNLSVETVRCIAKLKNCYQKSTHGGYILGWEPIECMDRRYTELRNKNITDEGDTITFESRNDLLDKSTEGDTISFTTHDDVSKIIKGLNGNGFGNTAKYLDLHGNIDDETNSEMERKINRHNEVF